MRQPACGAELTCCILTGIPHRFSRVAGNVFVEFRQEQEPNRNGRRDGGAVVDRGTAPTACRPC
jgi:hypothetical protein